MRFRTLTLVVLLGLLGSACGGADETTTPEEVPAAPTSAIPATPSGQPDTESSDVLEVAQEALDDVFATAGGSATVTMGDETWEFELFSEMPTSVCEPDFFGGFMAILTTGEDLMVPFDTLEIRLPGGDFQDPPYVKMTLAASGDAEWIADQAIYERADDLPSGLGVTEFSVNGTSASGTVLFYEEESFFKFNAGLVEELATNQGSFEVTCVAD